MRKIYFIKFCVDATGGIVGRFENAAKFNEKCKLHNEKGGAQNFLFNKKCRYLYYIKKLFHNFFCTTYVCKVMTKVKVFADGQTDRQTDRRTDRQSDYYRAPHFQCGGPNNSLNQ